MGGIPIYLIQKTNPTEGTMNDPIMWVRVNFGDEDPEKLIESLTEEYIRQCIEKLDKRFLDK
ncbi:hypothetical protein D3C74_159440 [compost metagenome]